jgi:choline monooxygenase
LAVRPALAPISAWVIGKAPPEARRAAWWPSNGVMSLNFGSDSYADPAIYALEREKIFRRAWQLLGPAALVAAPGQYITADIANVPIFIIRGQDGVLRGFHNVCPHRGATLLQASGRCAEVRCPYHDAHFDDGGQLANTEWFGDAVPKELAGLRLTPIAVKEWRGLLLAAISPVEEAVTQLGDAPGEVGDTPIETYTHAERRTVSVAANWKSYFDQYNEIWHTPQVHPADKNVGIHGYRAEAMDGLIRMTTAPGDGAGASAAYYGGKWMQMWPNWTLVLFKGGMKTVRINPRAADRFEADHDFYFADMAPEGVAERQRVADATLSIFMQDSAMIESLMRNYRASAYAPGPMHPTHERALIEYQRRIKAALNS